MDKNGRNSCTGNLINILIIYFVQDRLDKELYSKFSYWSDNSWLLYKDTTGIAFSQV